MKRSSAGQVIPVLVYLETGASWGDWAQILSIIGTDTHKVIHSAKLLISHQMKPYSSVKGHLKVSLYLFLCIY